MAKLTTTKKTTVIPVIHQAEYDSVGVDTPEDVARVKQSYTGQYLNKVLGRARVA